MEIVDIYMSFLMFLCFCLLFTWVLSSFHGNRSYLHGFFYGFAFLLVIYMGFKLFSWKSLLFTWVFLWFCVFVCYLYGFKLFVFVFILFVIYIRLSFHGNTLLFVLVFFVFLMWGHNSWSQQIISAADHNR